MWPDNETERDFLNFSAVADTVAEIVVQTNGRPISIGISGAWGTGKSSMIKLTQAALSGRLRKPDDRDFVFVEFNAWLYQGYDDARAALMDVIASRLQAEAAKRATAVDKVKDFLSRVHWLRATKLAVTSAVALSAGLPPVGLIGEAIDFGRRMIEGEATSEDAKEIADEAKKAADSTKGLVEKKKPTTPPKEIQALRNSFEEALDELGIILVVLIDDLDRCLPETTISTLEAIRLFLFLKNTAFVIAADTAMIKHAVRKHFDLPVEDPLVTSYFDKLIQVPIRVPPLGTQEVRAYMMMLFLDNSDLPLGVKEEIRVAVSKQLRKTWQGERVDRAFIQSLRSDFPPELLARFDTADRLAPIMTSASGIQGNPRLIKRFLNALAIRMTVARTQGVGVDEAVLAKLLLFERLCTPLAYDDLLNKVGAGDTGKPSFLATWESDAMAGKEFDLSPPYSDPFFKEWLTLSPPLADVDLRGALYVSREHAALISTDDRLSSEAAQLITALLKHPDLASQLAGRLAKVPRTELMAIMDRVLDRARQQQDWGVPPILDACLAVADVDATQGTRLAAFLSDLPPSQIKSNIVPKISGRTWTQSVFDRWEQQAVNPPVKTAIKKYR